MKKLLTFIAFVLITYYASAQQYKFNGDWSGKMTTKEGGSLYIRLKITDNTVTQYFWDDEGKKWDPVSPASSRFYVYRNNFVYSWINSGGVWTETQTFMLSYVNEDKYQLVWSRQVVNFKEEGDNEAWFVQGDGTLYEN